MTKKVRQLSNQRQEDDAENAGAEQDKSEKNSERQHPCKKEMTAGYGLNRKNKNIHKIREVMPWFKSSFQLRMDDKKQTEIPVSRVQTKRLRELLKL